MRPDGRPHAVPKWAVMVAGKIYCDGSPETRHARNVVVNPRVVLHLESGTEAVIVEGEAREMGRLSRKLGERIAWAYGEKYKTIGYAPKANQWDEGGLFGITNRSVMARTKFTEDPTKYVFEDVE